MKILALILLTLFQPFLYTKEKDIKMNAKFDTVETINYNYDNFKVIQYENFTEVYFNNQKILVYENPYSLKLLKDDKYFYIFIKPSFEDFIYLKVFNEKGTLYKDLKVSDNKFIGTINIIKTVDVFTIATSIKDYNKPPFLDYIKPIYLKEVDTVIFNYTITKGITKFKILGGKLNEYILSINEDLDNYYLSIKKDLETGGDFGNGGLGKYGYLILKITKTLDKFTYITLPYEIKSLEFNEKIHCFTNTAYYIFDYDLNREIGLKFDFPCVFGKYLTNYMVAILNEESLKIYDYKRNMILDSYNYPFSNSINDIFIIDDYIYLKDDSNIYKTIFYNNNLENKTFIFDRGDLDNLPKTLIGIPKNLEFKDVIYEKGYDQGVFGKYDINLKYDNILIKANLELKKRINITNNQIYPVGYKLLFSGKCFLNGVEIFNNYEITEEGKYEVRLVGRDEEIIKHFEIKNMDINYEEDHLKEWDYEVNLNKNLYIDYTIDNLESKNIKNVIVNGKDCFFKVDKNKNILSVILNYDTVGLKDCFLEKIVYESNNINYDYNINKHIIIKVINDKISLDNLYTNNKKYFNFSINVLNNNENLRFLILKSKGNLENVYYIPIKNGKITLPLINDSNELMDIYLAYDSGRKYLEEEYLFTIKYDFKNGLDGSILLDMEDNRVNNITIRLKNTKELEKVLVNDDLVYEYHKKSSYLPIIITTSCCICLFIILKVTKTIIKKKKLKQNN